MGKWHPQAKRLAADRMGGSPGLAAHAGPARKYKNCKVTDHGITFDSRKEHARWLALRQLKHEGRLTNLRVHVSFKLTASGRPIMLPGKALLKNGQVRQTQARYIADFTYILDGKPVIEDVKGRDTPLSKLKRALLAAEQGAPVILT